MESGRVAYRDEGSSPDVIRTRRLILSGRASDALENATISLANGVFGDVLSGHCDGQSRAYPDTLIIPALANAHDHGRGLKTLAYGAIDTAVEAWVPATYTLPTLDPYAVAALAFARMARAGITSIVHCHLSADPQTLLEVAGEVSRAAADVGVRVAFVVPLRDRHRLGYGDDEEILAHMDPQDIAAIRARWLRPIASIENQLDAVDLVAARFGGRHFTVQYGPVGMEWCSDGLLAEVARRADAAQRRVHMHMLESRIQRDWADRTYPGGPVSRLAKLGLLSPRLTLAHGVWLRPAETELLAEHGVTVSVNTSSNLRLKSGIAGVPAMKQANLNFAIGLDSLALDDDDDILRELRLAYLLHAGLSFDNLVTREDIFHAGTTAGACAVCSDKPAGRIEPGAPADFIVLDYASLAADIVPQLDRPFTTFFTRACTRHIAAVYAGGREIVRNGRVLGIDEASLQRSLSDQLAGVSEQIAALQPLLARFQRGLARFYACCG
jgi:cytosine/adenosine deaminase-related metal-dependent hydrolase